MSFSLCEINVKSKKQTKVRDIIKKYYFQIYNIDILNNNIIYALKQYVNFRVTKRYTGNDSINEFGNMIKELLEYCINKKYNNISKEDVNNNEIQIIYEIKKAIYYGALHSLYYKSNIQVKFFEETIENLKVNSLKNEKEVKDYFSDLNIL